MQGRFFFLLLAMTACVLAGCRGDVNQTLLPQTLYRSPHGTADTLVVLLPGIHDHAGSFEHYGFIDAARARGLRADMLAVDAHYDQYANGTIVRRLHDEVVLPAHTRGYRTVWLVGISLGGYGALSYARTHAEQDIRLLLLAPYLGPPNLIRAVRHHSAADTWPTASPDSNMDARPLWAWIREDASQPFIASNIYLAYGRDDRFIDSHHLLAQILPPAHIIETEGGHKWTTWSTLWVQALDAGIFTTRPNTNAADSVAH